MEYQYIARDKKGAQSKGFLDSPDKASAITLLKKSNLFVIDISEKRSEFKFFRRKLSNKDKIIFTKQLSIMIKAGLSIFEALKSLEEETSEKYFKEVLGKLVQEVEGGSPLSTALLRYTDSFGDVYVNMIKAGEKSGKVDMVLERLSTQLEKEYDLNRKVKGALAYPAFVFCAMIVVIVLITVIVMPQLKVIFEDSGVALPATTKAIISLSNFIQNHGLYLGIGLVILGILIWRFAATAAGKIAIDTIVLKIPIVSMLLKRSYMARFTRTFSSLASSGLPLVEVFRASGGVIGNSLYIREIDKMAKGVENGESVSHVFNSSRLFPKMVGQLALVGEKSGCIDEVFGSLAEFYEKDVEAITGNLSTMIQPILMVVIGVCVGFVIISVLQPIYGLINAM